jgi:glycosyltransferase involved in cell wall biosynthesis
MRILELVSTLGYGGAERLVSNLALLLGSKGHTVHIASLREIEALPVGEGAFKDAGVEIVRLNKKDGFCYRTARRLMVYTRDQQFDVVHTHNPLVHHYGALAAWHSHHAVLVNTVHGVDTLRMPAWARAIFYGSCLGTDHIACVSRAVQEKVQRYAAAAGGRVSVIPNGIDLTPFLAVGPKPRSHTITFGTVGRFAPVKDQMTLLRAFAAVRGEDQDVRLRLLGEGELESKLKQFSREAGLGDVIEFHRPTQNVAGFLEGLDVFVLSSRSEGLPLSLLEAMAAGRPVVATQVGGIPEVVEPAACGWLCPPGDPAALAATLLRATKDVELPAVGQRGRAVAAARYSDRTMADGYISLFETLLVNRRQQVGELAGLRP